MASGFKRNRGINWSEEETEELLDLWGADEIQGLLESSPHNKHAYDKIAQGLAQRGIDKTAVQCREKIKKLKSLYKKINNGLVKSERKQRGRLYFKLHEVLTRRAGSNATCLDGVQVVHVQGVNVTVGENETIETVHDPSADHRTRLSTEDLTNGLGGMADILAEAVSVSNTSDSSSSDAGELEGHQSSRLGFNASATGTTPRALRHERKKSQRHKSRKMHRAAVYTLIDKLISAQNTANERFAALEEQRLRLEKELEEKRFEAEARRQEAQRQHELRLLSTMAQQMGAILKSCGALGFATRCEGDVNKTHDVVAVSVSTGGVEYTTDGTVYPAM